MAGSELKYVFKVHKDSERYQDKWKRMNRESEITWIQGSSTFEMEEDELIPTINHPISEIILKAIQCNSRKRFVNLRIMAPQSSAKTTIINQFDDPENYGIQIIRNVTSANELINVMPGKLQSTGIHTLIFEDVTWMKGVKGLSKLLDGVKQYIDGKVGSNQCESKPPINLRIGIILTCPDDLFRQKAMQNAYTSATLESRFNDVHYIYSPIAQEKIIKDMAVRVNENKDKFEYSKILFKNHNKQEFHEINDKDRTVIKGITTVPRLAFQIMQLLRVGMDPKLLKFFKTDPITEIEYDQIR